MLQTIRRLIAPRCASCGAPKPLLSQVCDECWKHDPLNPDARY